MRGKRGNLALPALPLATPVVVQLQIAGGACLEATYETASRNDTGRFKARGQ